MKITLPPNFYFTSAIKSHYQSEEKYFGFFKFEGTDDAYGLALANLTLGLVKKDPIPVQNAKSLFKISNKTTDNIRAKELSVYGIRYADNLLSEGFKDAADEKITIKRINIKRQKPPVKNFSKIIIGKSSFKVKNGFRIKTQVNRVRRDWLSAHNISAPP